MRTHIADCFCVVLRLQTQSRAVFGLNSPNAMERIWLQTRQVLIRPNDNFQQRNMPQRSKQKDV